MSSTLPTTARDGDLRAAEPCISARDPFPERRGDWMQTYTGRRFWPLDPRPEDVAIEDIAHALSLQTRYGGHCLRFYSVAEHSVLLARSATRENALWLLLHDGAEAYLNDMVRPLKRHMPEYRAAEDRVAWAIYERFGLDPANEPREVKDLDNRILMDERAQIMRPTGDAWNYGGATDPLGVTIEGWAPQLAERAFLGMFSQITGLPREAPPPAQDPVPALGLPAGEVEGLQAQLAEFDTAYASCEGAEYESRPWQLALEAADPLVEYLRTHTLTPPASAADSEGLQVKRVSRLDDCCSACTPCSHQKRDPYSLCAVCEQVHTNAREEERRHALAKDASERASKNAGVAAELLYAPILWAIQDATTPPPVPPTREAGLEPGERQYRDYHANWEAWAHFDAKTKARWADVEAVSAPTPGETPGQDAVEATALSQDKFTLGRKMREIVCRANTWEDAAVEFAALASLRSTQADTGGESQTPAPDGGAVEALRKIANLSPEPDDKAWHNEWNEPGGYRYFGSDGKVHETGVDTSNHGDIEAWAHEKGLHAAAVIARAALAAFAQGPGAGQAGWLPIASAPKDGTIIGVAAGCAAWSESARGWVSKMPGAVDRPIQWPVTHYKSLDPNTLPILPVFASDRWRSPLPAAPATAASEGDVA
ncbi:hypothetical protein [Methylobacterium thuringiense]|uniref:Uncharacterized protein n=1 Tax=Methylobacterium thuringiense TaxID=1003091 RepID=A0ABQ4TL40_9HYPH|nr:hypothetical protein [Methylobacterium thuringiense]GJE54533.1 hypothetical protein EKPJFOCH_1011 [Methylobacterium thuringiense]